MILCDPGTNPLFSLFLFSWAGFWCYQLHKGSASGGFASYLPKLHRKDHISASFPPPKLYIRNKILSPVILPYIALMCYVSTYLSNIEMRFCSPTRNYLPTYLMFCEHRSFPYIHENAILPWLTQSLRVLTTFFSSAGESFTRLLLFLISLVLSFFRRIPGIPPRTEKRRWLHYTMTDLSAGITFWVGVLPRCQTDLLAIPILIEVWWIGLNAINHLELIYFWCGPIVFDETSGVTWIRIKIPLELITHAHIY